jgi:hypothetical protein
MTTLGSTEESSVVQMSNYTFNAGSRQWVLDVLRRIDIGVSQQFQQSTVKIVSI